MLMGATTGLLIGAMSRNKRNQTKHKDNKIYVCHCIRNHHRMLILILF